MKPTAFSSKIPKHKRIPPRSSKKDMTMTVIASPYLVASKKKLKLDDFSTKGPEDLPDKKELKRKLAEVVDEIAELQDRLYAHNRHSLLCVFQAMDAAGKDSTIRAVFSGVNPAGFQVFSFKQPSKEELDHDFLWRSAKRLPERGRIGIFNRSYYEEVLVVKVHPEYLAHQQLPEIEIDESFWEARYRSIRDHEAHLARSGVVVLKFFLNVSKDEQARRFLRRLKREDKHWKFSEGDLQERKHWAAYMGAYEQALSQTSSAEAPWYVIPADSKPYMRLEVATLVRDRLKALKLPYPAVSPEEKADFAAYKSALEAELNPKDRGA